MHATSRGRRAMLALLAAAATVMWVDAGAGAADAPAGAERAICPPPAPRHTCDGELDLTPPETKIMLAPGDTRRRNATFQFLATETSTFVCTLDGRQELKPCVSPLTIRVDKGRHTFKVTATDLAGNVDASPASATWRVKKRR